MARYPRIGGPIHYYIMVTQMCKRQRGWFNLIVASATVSDRLDLETLFLATMYAVRITEPRVLGKSAGKKNTSLLDEFCKEGEYWPGTRVFSVLHCQCDTSYMYMYIEGPSHISFFMRTPFLHVRSHLVLGSKSLSARVTVAFRPRRSRRSKAHRNRWRAFLPACAGRAGRTPVRW
jgi:hypothetical protein